MGDHLHIAYLIRDVSLDLHKHSYLNDKKIRNSIFKWAKGLYRHFSNEDTQTANKHMTFKVISHQGSANQNRNELYFILTGMTIKADSNKLWQKQKWEPLDTDDGV